MNKSIQKIVTADKQLVKISKIFDQLGWHFFLYNEL